ncbi:hypothetical protein MJO29_001700 [Puccinia striiformis f. sp. tritici]|nr:hypothetical protein MJO29_001700 [Puccinia striiformis f. sp. tritici]
MSLLRRLGVGASGDWTDRVEIISTQQIRSTTLHDHIDRKLSESEEMSTKGLRHQSSAHHHHQRRNSSSSTIRTTSETYSTLLSTIRNSQDDLERRRLMLRNKQSPIRKTIGSLIKSGQSRNSIISYSILFILLWKSLIGLGDYSGYQSPPLFGDLEAQRHWMALTLQINLKQWYSFDLQYWGLDYPPLTAYHSLLLGYIARLINPLFGSLRPPSSTHPNGWGDPLHQQLKIFLRSTVLISELFIWIPIVYIYHFKTFHYTSSTSSKMDQSQQPAPQSTKLSNSVWIGALYSIVVVLLNPNVLLIDNGHLQYNSIMLGLTLASVTCFYDGRDLLGAALFVCSMAFKQMALYYSPAIFAYLFGKCLYLGHPNGTKLFIKLAIVSISTILVLFEPFIFNNDFPNQILQVITRIFPLGRGLFEDKVGNFWCNLNLIIKIRNLTSVKVLANLSLLLTLVSIIPGILLIIIGSWKLNPSSSSSKTVKLQSTPLPPRRNEIPKTIELLPLALYNSSIGFYLFSFQVHEKSILLPVLPLLLILSQHHRDRKRPSHQFLNKLDWDIICLISNTSVFSMWPLLKREKLAIQYFLSMISYNHLIGYNPLDLLERTNRGFPSFGIILIYLAMVGIHISEQLIQAPNGLPDLYTVLNLALSFVVFMGSYFWSLLRIYEVVWSLVGFNGSHLNKTESEDKHKKITEDKDQSEEDPSVEDPKSLPTKRSSSLQQQPSRRKKTSSSDSESSESEELKSRSFGATPRISKLSLQPQPKRMLSGSRPSSKVMISSPSGEKLMNRIKNRLAVSRSISPSSSTSNSSSADNFTPKSTPKSKGKQKSVLDSDYPVEQSIPIDPVNHFDQVEKEDQTHFDDQDTVQISSSTPNTPKVESDWELTCRQSREEAVRKRREELLIARSSNIKR